MEAVRITVHAYTASFRVPGMMGYQVSAPVPPPATIYGLIAAAAGREVPPSETWVAYRFQYDASARDLETIITYTNKGPEWVKANYAPKTQPIWREFLYQARLVLYLAPGAAADAFLRPRFPLSLGRSQDVAYVAEHIRTQLDTVRQANVSGILLPFPTILPGIRSRIFNFPTFFPVAPTRVPLAVKPFHVLDAARGPQRIEAAGLLREANDPEGLAVPLFS